VTCQFEKIIKGQNQLPWVYSQVLKYELNGIYHFIEAMHA